MFPRRPFALHSAPRARVGLARPASESPLHQQPSIVWIHPGPPLEPVVPRGYRRERSHQLGSPDVPASLDLFRAPLKSPVHVNVPCWVGLAPRSYRRPLLLPQLLPTPFASICTPQPPSLAAPLHQ